MPTNSLFFATHFFYMNNIHKLPKDALVVILSYLVPFDKIDKSLTKCGFNMKNVSKIHKTEKAIELLRCNCRFSRIIQDYLDTHYLPKNPFLEDSSINFNLSQIWEFFRKADLKLLSNDRINSSLIHWTIDLRESESSLIKQRNKLSEDVLRYKKKYEKIAIDYKSLRKSKINVPKISYKEDDNKESYLETEVKNLNDKLIKVESDNLRKQEIITRLQSKIARLTNPIPIQSKNKNSQIIEIPKTDHCYSCESCKECDLNVLVVGGIERLRHNYEKKIKELGGRFAYHSGHKSGQINNIDPLVKWADLVICPVNVNSHFACKFVKRVCKKTNTSFKMIPNSGISSISDCVLAHSK